MYEIVVKDIIGDRHRYLVEELPDINDEFYISGELIIDVSEDEQVRYMLDKVISWSYRELNLNDKVMDPAVKVEVEE